MPTSCSEISVNGIVKHVQHIEIARAFCLLGYLLRFSVPKGTEKIAGLWFAWGDQFPGWHYVFIVLNVASCSLKNLVEASNGSTRAIFEKVITSKRIVIIIWFIFG